MVKIFYTKGAVLLSGLFWHLICEKNKICLLLYYKQKSKLLKYE